MFAAGMSTSAVAVRLRVTRQAVNGWRRAWQADGTAALLSKGPGGSAPKLDEGQVAVLQAELRRGPAAYGWDDQR